MQVPGSTTLLDAAFVRELEVLRRRLEIRARSGGSGDSSSSRVSAPSISPSMVSSSTEPVTRKRAVTCMVMRVTSTLSMCP